MYYTLPYQKFLCALRSLTLEKKSCNIIKNSHVQVSRLCYFLWLCLDTVDDVIKFSIYLWSTSKAMADREEKRGREKYGNLNILRMKKAF